LDRVDFRILAALHEDPLQSIRSLARVVQVSPPVAQDRFRKLTDRGILRGFYATLDPFIFGRQGIGLVFPPAHTREDALRALSVDGVLLVARKIEGGLTVQLWAADPQEDVARVARALGGGPTFQAALKTTSPAPLSPLDWRILRACIDHPRHTTQDLVQLTRISPRTAVKRRDALIASGALTIAPELGVLEGGGDVVFTLAVYGELAPADVRRHMGECVLIGESSQPPARYLLCRATGLADLTARIDKLRQEPAVGAAHVTLNREMWLNKDMMRRLVDDKLRLWERAKPSRR
jgi:DNA-binding Lrp family transcriptional regulator